MLGDTIDQHVESAKRILATARNEARVATASERAQAEAHLEQAKTLQVQRDLGRSLGSGNGGPVGGLMEPLHGGPGDQFIASEGFKKIADPSTRGQQWTTGAIPVGMQTKAGTLLEGTGGQGSGLVSVPQVVPGIVQRLMEPLGVAAVFGQGQTTSPSVRYMIEGTATSAAAGVAEGAVKPASDIAISTIDEPVRKVATVLTISDELLEDAVQVQTYLNSRLSLFVSLEEERQLLRGTGGNDLTGIFGRSGINTYTRAAADDNATAIARVLANTAGSSFLQPDTVILHPSNWLSTRLLRDGAQGTAGQFLGGGPFSAAYGQGGAADAGLFGAQLWNTRVVLSNYVGVGTALVGNFGQGAQIFRRGGPTVEATNAHQDYFQRNLAMLRAESRLALACYRPVAFTEVRGLA